MVTVDDFFKPRDKKAAKRKISQRDEAPKTSTSLSKDGSDSDVEIIEQKVVKPPIEKYSDTHAIEKPSPVKKAKIASPKKVAAPKKGAKVEATATTAEQVLAEIPSAELPEVDEEKKFNFFAKKVEPAAAALGTVDLPEAQPNCLTGLTIVFTGVLPRLDRVESENLAKRYGAKVTKSISGKTSLVVIGEEAGPSKIKKIKELKIKAINEDGFIQLISRMPMEGGDGEAAQKATQKREQEERKIIEDAERDEKEAQAQAKAELKEKLRLEEIEARNVASGDRLPREAEKVLTDSDKLWTTKYAPTSLDHLCGNKGQVKKLQNWLSHWFESSRNGFTGTSGVEGSQFRAVLISGPPGIGKTTSAHLIAKQLGFDVLEKNASDVRSKSLLNDSVKSVLNNTSVVGFFQKKGTEEVKQSRKFCLIMDEVDGMSTGDHGGAGMLSSFCKTTRMPIILICNDKSLPKMRTFDRVTFDLAFRRPSELEVRSRLMSIAHRENIKLDPAVIGQLVQATNNDIRQMINLMSTVSKTQKYIGAEQARDVSKSWKKQTILKPFDITSRLLNGQIYLPSAHHTLNDKIDLYFNDIDFAPLMIQENYLSTTPMNSKGRLDHLERVANAADSISLSDHVNTLIRSSEQQWSLLPFHGVMSSVIPCSQIAGTVVSRINFAGWLGQNSKAMKYQRMLQELQYHTRLRTSTDKKELRLEYVPTFARRLVSPLARNGEDGIAEVIEMMDKYYLSKEDWDNIVDFGVGASQGDILLKNITPKVKATFTRKYNAATHPVAIYKTGNSVSGSGGKSQKVDYEDVIEDDTAKDDDIEDEEKSDKIDTKKDKLIKEVKPKKVAKKTAKAAKVTKPKAVAKKK